MSEIGYDASFSADFASVSYRSFQFQTFSSNDSCGACTLSDLFVGVNRQVDKHDPIALHTMQLSEGILWFPVCRAYLAAVSSNGGQEVALLLPWVPLSLATIVANITAAIVQVIIA